VRFERECGEFAWNGLTTERIGVDRSGGGELRFGPRAFIQVGLLSVEE